MANLTFVKMDASFSDWESVSQLNNEAFPEEERMEDKHFKQLYKRGVEAYAIYDKEFIGFMIGTYSREYKMFYIWFLAIEQAHRSLGYGSKVLSQLEDMYPNSQWVVEIEVLNSASKNFEERLRRFSFYQRLGYDHTGWGVSYFGADFEIISKPLPFRKEEYEIFWESLWKGFRKAPELKKLS